MNCSYCYGHGHNKMGCPTAKERATTLLPQWEEWQNMEHEREWYKDSIYRAGQHFDWDYKHREALEIQLKKQKRSRKVKVCNFCGESGHNKRTCKPLKQVKQDMKAAAIGFRKAFVEGLKQTGQGVGAMIEGNFQHWNEQKGSWHEGNGLAIIQDIGWHLVLPYHCGDHGYLSLSGQVSTDFLKVHWIHGHSDCISAIEKYKHDIDSYIIRKSWRTQDFKIVSKSDSVTPSPEWLACEDTATKNFFKTAFTGRKASKLGEFQTGTRWRDFLTKWSKYE